MATSRISATLTPIRVDPATWAFEIAGAVKAMPASMRMRIGLMSSSFVGQLGLRLLGLLGLLGGPAAVDSIENGQLRLLNRSDGIVDREACLPLQALGVVLRAPHIPVALYMSNIRLQGVHVGSDFRPYRTPVSNGGVVN